MIAILNYLDCFGLFDTTPVRLRTSPPSSDSTSKIQRTVSSYPHSVNPASQPTTRKSDLEVQTTLSNEKSNPGEVVSHLVEDDTNNPRQIITARRRSFSEILSSLPRRSTDYSSTSNRSYSGLSDFGDSLTEDFTSQSPPESP